ncbi:MAG: acyl-CoA dehydrogenase family protein [Oceanicaulis sp.]
MTAALGHAPAPVLERLRAAPRRDDYPREPVQIVREAGWLAPSSFDAGALFDRLFTAGRGDLAAGRLFEGHVNALHLIERYGAPGQIQAAHGAARAGGLGGVWAASDPGDPARLDADGVLRGRLGYCSGAEKLAFALAAVEDANGERRLIRLAPGELAERFDHTAWRTTGMAATRSAALELDGLQPGVDAVIGAPGDYLAEPFFSAGAARFAAVQTGGLIAVFDAARDHLARTGRHGADAQAARLCEMAAACEAAYAAVRDALSRLAPAIDPGRPAPPGAAEAWIPIADGARQQVMNAAPGVIERAMACVGAAGFAADHPLAGAVSDLQMYLRQPAPDASRRRHGEAVGSGALALSFDLPAP